MWRQRTLKREVKCTGVGLHSGEPINLTLKPASPGTGIVFKRIDQPDSPEIKAEVGNVIDSFLNTTLGVDGAMVMTVEHLLAALAGCGVDNCLAEVDGPEAPIMDGSAGPFTQLIKSAGVISQAKAREVIKIKKPIKVTNGDKMIEVRPSDKAAVSCGIDFDHPLLQNQRLEVSLDFGSFDRDICRARTFGFVDDVEKLRRAGLAKGGSLDNTVVMDRFQVLNPSGLRYSDEFVRHKVLDMIGDLSLLGRPIIGQFGAFKSGHAMNHALLAQMNQEPDSWEVIALSPETVPEAEGGVFPGLAPLAAVA